MNQNNLYTDVGRRHDFVLLFDVTNGNPNGDPDAGNLPRIDPETMHGLVTDVCIKRKVRNYVAMTKPDEPPYKIYVQDRGIYLNDLHKHAHKAVGIDENKAKDPPRSQRDQAGRWMCENYYDIRTFGAVMSTDINCGTMRGPVQLTFARSVDSITPLDLSITRVALTDVSEERAATEVEEERGARTGTMGRKALIPYGLYIGHGFFNPALAEKTGFTSQDLALFWEALQKMWDLDRSASRGMMSCRGLYIFSHESKWGNAPAHLLLERVKVTRQPGIEAARKFEDYTVEVRDRDLPEGITLTRLI